MDMFYVHAHARRESLDMRLALLHDTLNCSTIHINIVDEFYCNRINVRESAFFPR